MSAARHKFDLVFTIALLLASQCLYARPAGSVGRSGLWLKLILLPFIFIYVLYRNRQYKKRRR